MVKIIILNYNTKELLENCIKAVIDNTEPGTYLVDIIDQGSTDGSKEYLRQLCEDNSTIPYKIDVLTHNIGIYPAWNKAIFDGKQTGYIEDGTLNVKAKISHDIVLLGSDTEVQADWLYHLQTLSDADDNIGIISSKLMKRAGMLKNGNQRYFICFGGSNDNDPRNPHIVGFEDKDKRKEFVKSKRQKWVTFSSVFIKKECLNDVGLFDTNLKIFSGDRDYCYRARDKGWKLFYCGKSRVLHAEGQTVNLLRDKDHIEFANNESWDEVNEKEMKYFHDKWNSERGTSGKGMPTATRKELKSC